MLMYLRKDWIYLDFKKYLYIDISSPKKTLNKLRGVFKPLKCYFKFEKGSYSPHPVLWVSKPGFIHIVSHDVGWKDKWHTPRYEEPPYIWIHLFKYNWIWYWELPNEKYMDDYWEQALWYLYYASYNKKKKGYDELDINKARDTWPWVDYETKQSNWNDKFLIK